MKKIELPHHVQFAEKLLADQDVHFYEKNVASQLIEFMSYYTGEMISQAQINRHSRDCDNDSRLQASDLKLAMKLKHQTCFTRPLSSQHLQSVAREKNAMPLAQLVLGHQHTAHDHRFMKMQPGTAEYSEIFTPAFLNLKSDNPG